jgi:hypothetical protein
MPAPPELHEIETVLRQTREALAQRSLSLPVRERWETILRRAEWAFDMVTDFRDRCGHCRGSGGITRPMLKDASGIELAWPSGYPRQICCPHCRGSGLLDRPDADGDRARWEVSP